MAKNEFTVFVDLHGLVQGLPIIQRLYEAVEEVIPLLESGGKSNASDAYGMLTKALAEFRAALDEDSDA